MRHRSIPRIAADRKPRQVAREAMMETEEFQGVEALEARGPDLVCRLGQHVVCVPRLLIASGSDVREAGDRGRLVIPRWLAIGLGLLSPFTPPGVSSSGSGATGRCSRSAA
jgi:hypothetical protein